MAAMERKLWWNASELVEKLSLGKEQRTKMDAAYASFEKNVQARSQLTGKQRSFEKALTEGRFDDARSDLSAITDVTRSPFKAMGELKIAVFELLTPVQRKQLASEYPTLVRQHWGPRLGWATGGQRPVRSPVAPAPK